MAESFELCSDIIYLLVSQMGTQELLQFSLTCKAFRDPALKQILSSPIEIHDNNQLIHFCACIMTDIHTRASWVKDLYLRASAFDWETDIKTLLSDPRGRGVAEWLTVSLVIEVLKNCHRLTSLRLPFISKLLSADSEFGPTIAALPNLQKLRLDHLEAEHSVILADFISIMQCRLHTLDMSFHPMWLLLNFPLYDPTTYASTMNLQRLVLENVTFPPENVQLSPWISLRELVITWSRVNLDEIPILAPNLRGCQYIKTNPSTVHIIGHSGRSLITWPLKAT